MGLGISETRLVRLASHGLVAHGYLLGVGWRGPGRVRTGSRGGLGVGRGEGSGTRIGARSGSRRGTVSRRVPRVRFMTHLRFPVLGPQENGGLCLS